MNRVRPGGPEAASRGPGDRSRYRGPWDRGAGADLGPCTVGRGPGMVHWRLDARVRERTDGDQPPDSSGPTVGPVRRVDLTVGLESTARSTRTARLAAGPNRRVRPTGRVPIGEPVQPPVPGRRRTVPTTDPASTQWDSLADQVRRPTIGPVGRVRTPWDGPWVGLAEFDLGRTLTGPTPTDQG